MIITQTPLRVSFLGGGTDYPEYFLQHGGAVLGTAIDKYAYLSVSRFYSQLFDYSIRLSYRRVECVRSLDEIEHAPFRECLRWCGLTEDVEIDYAAELPAFTGLGSSSSFVVGLLNSLYAYQGKLVRPIELAYQAIELERNVLGESVGCQDQVFAAVGGINLVEFRRLDDIVVHRVPLARERSRELQDHLVLAFTGLRRSANELASRQVKRVDENLDHLQALHRMADDGYRALINGGSLETFGRLLNESWCHKRQLDARISNDTIDRMYKAAVAAGAWGGKLLGAGGGGFILFVVPPERREAVAAALGQVDLFPISIAAPGSHVIHA